MGIVILLLCLSAALNLALWAAFWRLINGMPLRIFGLSRQERAADEAHALAVLEAAAAARINVLTLSLRSYEEQLAERSREAVAAAELRARVAEGRSTAAVSALGAASQLVGELRTLVMDFPRGQAWLSDRPSDAEGDRTCIGTLPSREALGLPPAPLPTEPPVAERSQGGAP
jgi:hypothetical protein